MMQMGDNWMWSGNFVERVARGRVFSIVLLSAIVLLPSLGHSDEKR